MSKPKIFVDVERLVKAMRDIDSYSLHDITPAFPVNIQQPIFIDWRKPTPEAEKVYSLKKIEGFRVFNVDMISYDAEGHLLLGNTPRYDGVHQGMLSKQMHAYGKLMVWLRWGNRPQDGADESFGFADPDHIGGLVDVRITKDGFFLVVRDMITCHYIPMPWQDTYMERTWLYMLTWSPYEVRLCRCNPDPALSPATYKTLGKVEFGIPRIPLDISLTNYDSEAKLGETKLEIEHIEYYPFLGGEHYLTAEKLVDAFEIRDTAWHYGAPDPDVPAFSRAFQFGTGGAKNIHVLLYNELNQAVDCTAYGHWTPDFTDPTVAGWSFAFGGVGAGAVGSPTLGEMTLYDRTEDGTIDTTPVRVVRKQPIYPFVKLGLRCTTAPTSGSVSVVIIKSLV